MMSLNAIQVSIKMRPCESQKSSHWLVDEQSIKPTEGPADVFANVFDYAFDEGASNHVVFDQMAKHIVHSCLQGFNGTILAYGQSSSGKTYTMMGDAENPGVMVLTAKEIFHLIANDTEREFLLRVGHIEILNEKMYDLLKENQDTQIHEAADGALSVGCEEIIVASEDELLYLLCPHTNERYKGSHAIIRITIESRKPECPGSITQSVLNLVDLAGTGPNAPNNRSLMFLNKVIKNLSNTDMDDRCINFPDSKLTRILQPTLSGNGFTSIICAIKPWVLEETRSTLNFATLAKKIILKPHANNIVCDPRMEQLDTEIRHLQHQVAAEKRRGGSLIYLNLLKGRIQEISNKFVSRGKLWPAKPFEEGALRAFLKDQKAKVCELQAEMESQLEQMQLKDSNIAELKAEIEKLVAQEKQQEQQLFDAQSQKLSGDNLNLLIEQLHAKLAQNEVLKARLAEMELNIARLELENREMESQSKQMQLKDTNIAELKAEIEKLLVLEKQQEQQLLYAQSQKLSDEEVNLLMGQLQEANAKLAQNEVLKARLAEMELNSARLELKNREAVDLEFQFEAYKRKSSLREKDLVDALELQRQHQQEAIETLQADFQTIQTFQQKQNASEEQCQQLRADNTRLQAEIGTLKERSTKVISSSSDDALLIEQLLEANAKLAQNEVLKARLAEMELDIARLELENREMESQSKQMQLKDTNIAELKAKIEKLAQEKQLLFDALSQTLSDDALRIEQLKERNAWLAECQSQLEARPEPEQTIPSSEPEKQIEETREALRKVNDELVAKNKQKTDEINALKLQYMTETRAVYRGYTLELEETKARYEAIVASLKEQLLQATRH